MTDQPAPPEKLSRKDQLKRLRPFLWPALIVLVLALLGTAYFLRKGSRPPAPSRSQPVSAAEVAIKDMPVWITAIGSAVPRNLVTIRTRVDGELIRVYFTEGQIVKKGQLLAEIDPRPFQAQLTQVNGQLARDSAQLQNAQLDLRRYQDLWAKDSIAKQQLDTQEALVRQYQGTVENDRGLVQNAKLQLSYTQISAPVSGRIGLRLVDPGNQVHASDANGLAAVAQVEPMTVVFAVPEINLPEITRRMASGETLKVEAWDREQKNLLASGKLLTADNLIDSTTGTVKLKAVFANAGRSLFPNQFVNVRLLLGVREGSTVVPTAAIQRGTQGAFVYTIDAENTVKSVPVTTGTVDGELTAVDSALKPGEKVVTDGSDKLRDGAKVEVMTPEKRQAPANGGQKPGRRDASASYGKNSGGSPSRGDAS